MKIFINTLIIAIGLLFAAVASAEKVTINFKDTDIREVAEMVSKVSGKNFLIDPRVKGAVTVISSEPLDGEALYSTFLSILRVHGFVAVDDGNLVRILPASSAREVAPLSVQERGKADDRIEVRVIAIEHVPAMQMVPILRPLVEKEGHLAAHANSNSLIVAASGRTIAKIENMLAQLDQEAEAEIETIPLKYAVASEVVATLQTVIRQVGGDAGKKGVAAAGTRLVADDRTNSILVSGNTGFRDKVRTIVKQLDTVVRDNRNVHVVSLRFAKAEDLAPIIEQLASEGDVQASAKGGDKGVRVKTKVQADESTNSLIVTANPDRMKELRSVIRKLDVRRSQVLVEGIIVEVSKDKSSELGIQWVGLNNALLPENRNSDGDPTGGVDYSGFANTLTPGTIVGLVTGGDYTFAAIGSALANDSDANILSTPSLLTLDNEEAEITVGQEVPFLTGSYTQTGTTTNPDSPFTTVERKSVGLTLKITPQISAGNAVALKIDQEISKVLPQASEAIGAVDVVTTQRNIKTNVIVDDGDILVLGGLIDDDVGETEQRIPIIGDIPILGEPFKYRTASAVKRNLMIFIRPQILRNQKSNLAVTRERYDDSRRIQLDKYEKGITLMPSSDQPILPPLDERGREIPYIEPVADAAVEPKQEQVWVH